MLPTPNLSSGQLNIAAIATRTQALGPGTRAVIWVKGCPLNCPGCLAPGWMSSAPHLLLTPQEVLEQLDLNQVDGLTFSGGEPMEQAAGLATLAQLVRKMKSLSIICFTGYRYEQVIREPTKPGVMALLAEVDVLIDGPYVQSRNDSIGLRGSSNQRVIHLTDRLKSYDLEMQQRRVEITITGGEISFIGIPTPAVKTALDRTVQAFSERK